VPSDIDPLRRGIETSTQKNGTRRAVGGGRFDFRHTSTGNLFSEIILIARFCEFSICNASAFEIVWRRIQEQYSRISRMLRPVWRKKLNILQQYM